MTPYVHDVHIDVWRQMAQETIRLFFVGQIFYTDIFGRRYECGFAVRTALGIGGGFGFTADGCERYNYQKTLE
jgi:hypothetical protein